MAIIKLKDDDVVVISYLVGIKCIRYIVNEIDFANFTENPLFIFNEEILMGLIKDSPVAKYCDEIICILREPMKYAKQNVTNELLVTGQGFNLFIYCEEQVCGYEYVIQIYERDLIVWSL